MQALRLNGFLSVTRVVGETQLIQAAHGDTVRMAALATLDPLPRWLEDADEADADEGARWLEFCVQGWLTELSR